MVLEGTQGIKRISVEDILNAVRTNKNTRGAVIRLLVRQFSGELIRNFQIVAKQAAKTKK